MRCLDLLEDEIEDDLEEPSFCFSGSAGNSESRGGGPVKPSRLTRVSKISSSL
jgi:hypothetical protein